MEIDLTRKIKNAGNTKENKRKLEKSLNLLPDKTFCQYGKEEEKIIATFIEPNHININYWTQKNCIRIINFPSKTNYNEESLGKQFSFEWENFNYRVNIPSI